MTPDGLLPPIEPDGPQHGQPPIPGAESRLPAPPPPAASTPLDLTDGRWRRPAARSLLVTPLKTARELVPTLAPLVVLAISQGGSALWLLLGVVVLPVALAVLRWWNIGYRIADDQFQVRHGILRKHRLTAQLDRIRTVDAEASLLRRALRLVDLHVGTGAHEAVSVHGIDATQAEQLHRVLLSRRPRNVTPSETQAAGPAAAHPDGAAGAVADATYPTSADGTASAPPERVVAEFTPGWLRFAPFTMSGVATALTAWALASRLINDLDLRDSLTPWLERARAATADVSILVLVLELLLTLVVTLSVLSVAAYALANWGYRLTRRADATLHVRRGLLTSRAVTIEERRLRGVVVERPLLLRIPRGARAKALLTGGKQRAERGSGATHLLVPPAPAYVVEAAVADVLVTAAPLRVSLTRHGPRATRRRYSRAFTALTPWAGLVALAAWWWAWPRWTYVGPLALLALAPVLGALRARWLGHALVGDATVLEGPTAGYVVASSGAFPQARALLRARAIIGWQVRATWFQRRAGLVTLEATVATPSGFVRILDVPRDRAVDVIRAATPGLLDPFVTPPAS